jgi:hypothetical protein
MNARSIRTQVLPAMGIAIALFAFGCTKAPSSETTAADKAPVVQTDANSSIERAREAGQMAAEMTKDPDRIQEILDAHHMTADAYQALLIDIAEDPALTDAYEAARAG